MGWGRGRWSPPRPDWHCLLQRLTDCSPESLTTNPINISPPGNAETAQSLNSCGMLICYETLCSLESNPSLKTKKYNVYRLSNSAWKKNYP